jgi:polar amino acid transport system substrate-binding protein
MKMKKMKIITVFSIMLLSICSVKAQKVFSKEYESQAKGKLKIATRDLEPFSFVEDGERKGYSVDLWNEVCKNLNIDYEWVVVNSAKEIVSAVKDGKADLGVGAISVTFDRELVVDFSHPFYESGFQILVNKSDDSYGSTINILKKFISWDIIIPILVVFILIFIISNLIWFFERKINPSQWPVHYKPGIVESVWFTLSTMLVGGVDNKGPIGIGGRIVTLLWMIASTILISFVTASLTTTMTVNKLNSKINGPKDLPGLKVATIKGSSSYDWLKKKNINAFEFADLTACINELQKNKVDAVVYDAPLLQYELSKYNSDKINLVGPVFNRQYYSFPLKDKDPMLQKINEVLLKLHEKGFITDLKRKYFNDNY